jgi:hypothetical protein
MFVEEVLSRYFAYYDRPAFLCMFEIIHADNSNSEKSTYFAREKIEEVMRKVVSETFISTKIYYVVPGLCYTFFYCFSFNLKSTFCLL